MSEDQSNSDKINPNLTKHHDLSTKNFGVSGNFGNFNISSNLIGCRKLNFGNLRIFRNFYAEQSFFVLTKGLSVCFDFYEFLHFQEPLQCQKINQN